jgi:nitrogen regulatory protein PII
VKKIEAIIDPETLEAVKLRLAEVGIGGRLTVIQANCLEDIARFYQFEAGGASQWKPCLRLDLTVSDRLAHSAINIILQYAKPMDRQGTKAHINVFSLDAALENAPEVDNTPPKENRKPKVRLSLPSNVPPVMSTQQSKSESGH